MCYNKKHSGVEKVSEKLKTNFSAKNIHQTLI